MRAGRVVHLVPTLYDRDGKLMGGAERYALELARQMAEVVPTTLVSFGEEPREELAGRLRVRILGRPWYVRGQRNNPVHPGMLGEILRAEVVHCHQTHVLASSLAAVASRVVGRRVFTTDLGGGGWDLSAYVSTDRWFHGHLHISEYSRRVYRQAGDRRAWVVYGGVDTEKFAPGEGVPEGAPVLFVGRLLPHKGVDDLIRAVPAELPLRIVGRPHDPEFLRSLKGLAEGKDVRFEHDFDDAALVRAYQGALCVVLPSVYRPSAGGETAVPELLGQTLLEGMACGIPAVCTDVASMPEIVEHGVTGYVVPPNDPAALGETLLSLSRDRERAAAVGAAARRAVLESFTWPAVVERCLRIYRR